MTTWTIWTFECGGCGRLTRASAEAIKAHADVGEDIHPRDIADTFENCVQCMADRIVEEHLCYRCGVLIEGAGVCPQCKMMYGPPCVSCHRSGYHRDNCKHLIDVAAEEGGLAFWKAVKKSFPKADPGSLPPDDWDGFDRTCRSVIETWVRINVK